MLGVHKGICKVVVLEKNTGASSSYTFFREIIGFTEVQDAWDVRLFKTRGQSGPGSLTWLLSYFFLFLKVRQHKGNWPHRSIWLCVECHQGYLVNYSAISLSLIIWPFIAVEKMFRAFLQVHTGHGSRSTGGHGFEWIQFGWSTFEEDHLVTISNHFNSGQPF